MGDGEVVLGKPGENSLVEGRDTDEGVVGAELKGEDGITKVVPVDYKFGVAEEADDAGDC